jgi:hypothetical protein
VARRETASSAARAASSRLIAYGLADTGDSSLTAAAGRCRHAVTLHDEGAW